MIPLLKKSNKSTNQIAFFNSKETNKDVNPFGNLFGIQIKKSEAVMGEKLSAQNNSATQKSDETPPSIEGHGMISQFMLQQIGQPKIMNSDQAISNTKVIENQQSEQLFNTEITLKNGKLVKNKVSEPVVSVENNRPNSEAKNITVDKSGEFIQNSESSGKTSTEGQVISTALPGSPEQVKEANTTLGETSHQKETTKPDGAVNRNIKILNNSTDSKNSSINGAAQQHNLKNNFTHQAQSAASSPSLESENQNTISGKQLKELGFQTVDEFNRNSESAKQVLKNVENNQAGEGQKGTKQPGNKMTDKQQKLFVNNAEATKKQSVFGSPNKKVTGNEPHKQQPAKTVDPQINIKASRFTVHPTSSKNHKIKSNIQQENIQHLNQMRNKANATEMQPNTGKTDQAEIGAKSGWNNQVINNATSNEKPDQIVGEIRNKIRSTQPHDTSKIVEQNATNKNTTIQKQTSQQSQNMPNNGRASKIDNKQGLSSKLTGKNQQPIQPGNDDIPVPSGLKKSLTGDEPIATQKPTSTQAKPINRVVEDQQMSPNSSKLVDKDAQPGLKESVIADKNITNQKMGSRLKNQINKSVEDPQRPSSSSKLVDNDVYELKKSVTTDKTITTQKPIGTQSKPKIKGIEDQKVTVEQTKLVDHGNDSSIKKSVNMESQTISQKETGNSIHNNIDHPKEVFNNPQRNSIKVGSTKSDQVKQAAQQTVEKQNGATAADELNQNNASTVNKSEQKIILNNTRDNNQKEDFVNNMASAKKTKINNNQSLEPEKMSMKEPITSKNDATINTNLNSGKESSNTTFQKETALKSELHKNDTVQQQPTTKSEAATRDEDSGTIKSVAMESNQQNYSKNEEFHSALSDNRKHNPVAQKEPVEEDENFVNALKTEEAEKTLAHSSESAQKVEATGPMQVKQTSYTNMRKMIHKIERMISIASINKLNKSSITMDGKEYGKLEIKVRQNSKDEQGVILVENHSVKEQLQKIVPDIQENLNQKGSMISEVNVEVGNQKENSDAQRQFNQSNAQKNKDNASFSTDEKEHKKPRQYGYNTMEILA